MYIYCNIQYVTNIAASLNSTSVQFLLDCGGPGGKRIASQYCPTLWPTVRLNCSVETTPLENIGNLDCIIMGQGVTSTNCTIDEQMPLECELCMLFTVVTMLSCCRNTYSSYAYYSPVIHLKVCTTVLQVMSSQLLSVLSGSPKEIILSPWQPIFQTSLWVRQH